MKIVIKIQHKILHRTLYRKPGDLSFSFGTNTNLLCDLDK